MEHLVEGAPAPDFELHDISGRPFRLALALDEGPLTLVFFKTSCPTCYLTFPYLQRIWAGYAPFHPRIFGVSQDSIPETRRFALELHLELPFLIDEHPFAVSDVYAVRSVPTIYLIDRAQRIRIADCGFSKPALRSLNREIARGRSERAVEVFPPDDGRPEGRPGCGSNN